MLVHVRLRITCWLILCVASHWLPDVMPLQLNIQISYDSSDAAHVGNQLTHGALFLDLSQQTRSGLTAIWLPLMY